jgi:hypothetical protein
MTQAQQPGKQEQQEQGNRESGKKQQEQGRESGQKQQEQGRESGQKQQGGHQGGQPGGR